jgi:hypothetical protein
MLFGLVQMSDRRDDNFWGLQKPRLLTKTRPS